MNRRGRTVMIRGVPVLFTLLLLSSSMSNAQVRLPHLIGDGMVLQRTQPVPIWGWATPGTGSALVMARGG